MIDISTVKQEHFWYTVGLITTDGNLSPDGRHINITSKDIDLLISVKNALGLKTKITLKGNGYSIERLYGALQVSDVHFYQLLMSLGLKPRKSLTLGTIVVEEKYFPDFLRGVIDGDGSIRHWIHPTNGSEQWELKIRSAAHLFASWLYDSITTHFQVRGTVFPETIGRKHCIYTVKFGKMAARKILSSCYYINALSLKRKHKLANECMMSPRGWKQSLTVLS